MLEWGAGRSTLFFSGALEKQGVLGSWTSLEHNREFFMGEIAEALESRPTASYALSENVLGDPAALAPAPESAGAPTLGAVVFDAGDLRPYDPEREDDRRAELDDYVSLPASLGRRFDIVIVDGRKRRRCLLEASHLLSDNGIVILHDAWRSYYQCAFEAYASGTRVGDELWVGAQSDPDLGAILPRHAFENHFDSG